MTSKEIIHHTENETDNIDIQVSQEIMIDGQYYHGYHPMICKGAEENVEKASLIH